MRRPSFQFYPADWRKDAALQSCSIAAQGLWINVMCIAHECEPYGHLKINGKPMVTAQLGRLVGLSAKECQLLIDELTDAGVISFDDDGAMFSRRMVKDEALRNVRASGGKAGSEHGIKGAEYGKFGGRPRKETGDKKPPLPDAEEPPLNPPPSSSSSSSASTVTNPDGLVAGSEAADQPPKPAKPDCPHQQIIDLYHRTLPASPEIRDWTPNRATLLRTRWNEAPERQNLDWWQRFFEYVSESEFLTGRRHAVGRKPFCAPLEWILKAENFAKIREGRYHGDGT